MFAFCSIIVVTTQFLSPALHKNFSEADFDFKVCVIESAASYLENEIFTQNILLHILMFYLAFFILLSMSVCVSGVELFLQPHCALHQPAQSPTGGTRSSQEKESPRQVRKDHLFIVCRLIMYSAHYI